jgi:DNA (cytosine-5)-methyltransferase 1
MDKPRILDLYCGAGGAARGYQLAGFHVTGIDFRPQPRYAGDEFIQADAIGWLTSWLKQSPNIFDAIHASPPCQAHTRLRHRTGKEYPDLVDETRYLLIESGLPYIIENVPGAPLIDPVVLCGSMFGLGATGPDGVWRQLRRHRLFETNWNLVPPTECHHVGQPVGVYGHGGGGQMSRGYKGNKQEYRDSMGIDWATKAEIAQAIPPAYTNYIGGQLIGEWIEKGRRL